MKYQWIAIIMVSAVALAMLCACGARDWDEVKADVEREYDRIEGIKPPPGAETIQFDYAAAVKSGLLPPLPAGMTRVYGVLNSASEAAATAATWTRSQYAVFVEDARFTGEEKPTAWFYVDYDPLLAQVIDARGFIFGQMGQKSLRADLKEKVDGVYGEVRGRDFEFDMGGPVQIRGGKGERWNLFIAGRGDLLKAPQGAVFQVRYVAGDAGSTEAMRKLAASDKLEATAYNFGTGLAVVERGPQP